MPIQQEHKGLETKKADLTKTIEENDAIIDEMVQQKQLETDGALSDLCSKVDPAQALFENVARIDDDGDVVTGKGAFRASRQQQDEHFPEKTNVASGAGLCNTSQTLLLDTCEIVTVNLGGGLRWGYFPVNISAHATVTTQIMHLFR